MVLSRSLVGIAAQFSLVHAGVRVLLKSSTCVLKRMVTINGEVIPVSVDLHGGWYRRGKAPSYRSGYEGASRGRDTMIRIY